MTEAKAGYPYLTKGLLHRRARIAGEIVSLRTKLGELEHILSRIDATVQHFNPGVDPEALKPVRPYQRLKLFRQGELRTKVMKVLKTSADPLHASVIATKIIAMGGFDSHDQKLIESRVRQNVWNLIGEGRVYRVRKGKFAYYGLVQIGPHTRFKVGRLKNMRSTNA